MNDTYEGKVCVVTGAGSGIGRALSLALAARGAALAISDIKPDALAETQALIDGKPSNRLRADALDVSDAAAVERYAPLVRESLGPADYVFNVAGLARIGAFKETPLSSIEKVMNVNYWGVVRMSKAFLPQLIETKGGLINISSVFGLIAVPGQSHYCSSKFAVRGFSEAIAAELEEEGVRVTSVHPGGVATNIARNAVVDALPPGAGSAADVAANFDKIAITSAEAAAEVILKGAAKGKRRIIVGPDARLISFLQRLFPASYPKLLKVLRKDSLNPTK
ncbi:MAG: SDR family NAD(P)-dependent oxidoreductase [Pseudomonadota bacterium]|nr:SDR family NAD(P)-dependent oxidoreductase [Pseudomonadota bacterium]